MSRARRLYRSGQHVSALTIGEAALALHRAADQVAQARAHLLAAGPVVQRPPKALSEAEHPLREIARSLYVELLISASREVGLLATRSLQCLDTTEDAARAVAWLHERGAAGSGHG